MKEFIRELNAPKYMACRYLELHCENTDRSDCSFYIGSTCPFLGKCKNERGFSWSSSDWLNKLEELTQKGIREVPQFVNGEIFEEASHEQN